MSERGRYRRSPTVLARSVGDEVVLARADGDGFEVLEGTAGAVWAVLEEPVTTDEIVSALSRAFEAPREVIENDVDALLRELTARGMIQAIDEGHDR